MDGPEGHGGSKGMSLPTTKSQPKTYLRLMAECVAALNGDSVDTAEETIRLSLTTIGHEAVLQKAMQVPPRLWGKQWLRRLRRDKRRTLHQLVDEVYAAAGVPQPTLDLPQLVALDLAVTLQRGKEVPHGSAPS
jgi:hypothetical protein